MNTAEYLGVRSESARIEFEETWSEVAEKALVAFANTYCGTLYLGMKNNAEPVGVEDFERTARTVLAFARHGVEPDMSRLVRVDPRTLPDGKEVIEIRVLPGDDRPYAFREKGWATGGVYVRVGSASVQATRADIKDMAMNTIPWEEGIVRKQTLSYNEVRRVCQSHSVPFERANHLDYGITDARGRYTNFGFLLSDQNHEEIRINEFLGEGGRLSGVTLLSGSIRKQREDAQRFLLQCGASGNDGTGAENDGDIHGWPLAAVREALTLCLLHHDFECKETTPVTVNVCADRMEFLSLVSLPARLTIRDLQQVGSTFSKNRRLRELFLRLRWTEKAGSGFSDIFVSYSCSVKNPTCSGSARILKIALPKLQNVPSLSEKIVFHLRTYGVLGARKLEEKTNAARSSLNKALRELVEAKRIVRVGNGRSTRYMPAQ